MKKLAATCFAVLLMTFAAGAANVGTIDNAYPGDTEAQAQMLYDLGLFRGTEKGFELEQPMTRAEAAVMLTRFLGAEQTALEGAWTHPFTDVPEWAAPYLLAVSKRSDARRIRNQIRSGGKRDLWAVLHISCARLNG